MISTATPGTRPLKSWWPRSQVGFALISCLASAGIKTSKCCLLEWDRACGFADSSQSSGSVSGRHHLLDRDRLSVGAHPWEPAALRGGEPPGPGGVQTQARRAQRGWPTVTRGGPLSTGRRLLAPAPVTARLTHPPAAQLWAGSSSLTQVTCVSSM